MTKRINSVVYVGFSGCKVNQFEKNLLAEKFLELGFSLTSTVKEANIIVYNTCCVTKKAENGCKQTLAKFHKENPLAEIVVTGCFAEKNKDRLLSLPFVTKVVGNTDKNSIPQLVAELNLEKRGLLDFEFRQSFKDRSRAILKVQDGCDSYCSYCIVPFVRGKPISMDKEVVLKNLHNLKEEKEVVLTGIHLGKWGIEFGENLSSLLSSIKASNFPFRIRLSSLDPTEINDKLLDILNGMNNFCHHFHISLQSVSDKILRLMGRRYSGMDFVKTVEKIRHAFPLAGIGVDVIVGFPGEDGIIFKETEEILKETAIDYMHVFPYSKREGTKAAEMDSHVSLEDKRYRVKRLKELDTLKRKNFVKRFYNKSVLCLMDKKEGEFYRAVTREYLKVYLKENPGKDEFLAKIIDAEKPIAVKV